MMCRFVSEGKETAMAPVGASLSPSTQSGGRSMYDDRVTLSHITSNPLLGDPKKVSSITFLSFHTVQLVMLNAVYDFCGPDIIFFTFRFTACILLH